MRNEAGSGVPATVSTALPAVTLTISMVSRRAASPVSVVAFDQVGDLHRQIDVAAARDLHHPDETLDVSDRAIMGQTLVIELVVMKRRRPRRSHGVEGGDHCSYDIPGRSVGHSTLVAPERKTLSTDEGSLARDHPAANAPTADRHCGEQQGGSSVAPRIPLGRVLGWLGQQ